MTSLKNSYVAERHVLKDWGALCACPQLQHGYGKAVRGATMVELLLPCQRPYAPFRAARTSSSQCIHLHRPKHRAQQASFRHTDNSTGHIRRLICLASSNNGASADGDGATGTARGGAPSPAERSLDDRIQSGEVTSNGTSTLVCMGTCPADGPGPSFGIQAPNVKVQGSMGAERSQRWCVHCSSPTRAQRRRS